MSTEEDNLTSQKLSAAMDRLHAETLPFPMQDGPAITWPIARKIYQTYVFLFGTDQSLERIAERGGFYWSEVSLMYQRKEVKREKRL